MRKNLCWLVLMLLVMATLNSGCGGSSNTTTTGNENNGTPQNQSQDVTPEIPGNQSTTYPFTTLTGTWTASNGSGTATGGGVNATMTLKGGQVSLTNATSGGSLDVSANIRWDAVQNGSVLVSDVRDNFGGSGSKTFTHVSGNTWRLSGTDDDGPYSTTVTITSATTATVERDGYYSDNDFSGVHFHMSYTITKQASEQTPGNQSGTYDISALTGTWTVSNGIMTVKEGNETGSGTVSGTVTFSNVVVSGDNKSVKATMTRTYDWVRDNGQSGHEDEVLYPVFEKRGNNVWYYSKYGTLKNDEEDTITLTMTSSRTANVVEDDRNPLDPNSDYYHCTYTLTKQ